MHHPDAAPALPALMLLESTRGGGAARVGAGRGAAGAGLYPAGASWCDKPNVQPVRNLILVFEALGLAGLGWLVFFTVLAALKPDDPVMMDSRWTPDGLPIDVTMLTRTGYLRANAAVGTFLLLTTAAGALNLGVSLALHVHFKCI